MKENTPQKQFDYYAFISYKRTDWKWAKWMREKLQSYRLPNSTYKRHDKQLTKRFNPIFLDKMNLTPGMLEEGLKTEVQSSKYLIVICSRAARNDSKYLDEEIQFFIEGGGDLSRIIPFMIEESDDPVHETFPLRLREEWEKSPEGAFSVNAETLGRRNAFLEVVSYMHGISSTEIIRDDKKRRVVRWASISVAAVGIIAGALYARYRYIDYYTPKTLCYRDYVERFGVAEGIDQLTEDQVRHRLFHYSITMCEGKVTELRRENSHDTLIYYEDGYHDDCPVSLIYEYKDGVLDKKTYRDTDEKPIIVIDYTDASLKVANITQYSEGNSDDSYVEAAFISANSIGAFNVMDQDEDAVKSNIVRYIYEYDENGFA